MKTYNLGAENFNDRRFYVTGITTKPNGDEIEWDEWSREPHAVGEVKTLDDGTRIEYTDCQDIGPKPKKPTRAAIAAKKKLALEMGWLFAFIDADNGLKVLYARLENAGWMRKMDGVWMRPFVRRTEQQPHIDFVKSIAPYAANIGLLWISDQQWGEGVTVIGANRPK